MENFCYELVTLFFNKNTIFSGRYARQIPILAVATTCDHTNKTNTDGTLTKVGRFRFSYVIFRYRICKHVRSKCITKTQQRNCLVNVTITRRKEYDNL